MGRPRRAATAKTPAPPRRAAGPRTWAWYASPPIQATMPSTWSHTETSRIIGAGAAGPAPSVGGRGTDRPSSAGFARATDPGGGSEGAVEAPFDDLGGLRRRGDPRGAYDAPRSD